MAELADTVRRLVDLVVTNTAPPDVLDDVVAQLRSTADVLAAHVPAQPGPRFIDPPEGTGPTVRRARRWTGRCPMTPSSAGTTRSPSRS